MLLCPFWSMMTSVVMFRDLLLIDPPLDYREWPDKGALNITNLATRYRPGLDLVLKGITATVKPQEKVGIFSISLFYKDTICSRAPKPEAWFGLVIMGGGHTLGRPDNR